MREEDRIISFVHTIISTVEIITDEIEIEHQRLMKIHDENIKMNIELHNDLHDMQFDLDNDMILLNKLSKEQDELNIQSQNMLRQTEEIKIQQDDYRKQFNEILLRLNNLESQRRINFTE